ncbi:MAG: hypothetical protein U9N61_03505, partial [Euryarchaeota archaeon]|nr:hypothetical protein [Euryarchaeota archaeon]
MTALVRETGSVLVMKEATTLVIVMQYMRKYLEAVGLLSNRPISEPMVFRTQVPAPLLIPNDSDWLT